jgi:hypothetical protein
VGFETAAGKAWRSTNYALSKGVEIAEFVISVLDTSALICEALPSDAFTVVAKAACVLTVSVVKTIADNVSFAANAVRLNIHYQLILVACIKCIIHAHHHRSVCT